MGWIDDRLRQRADLIQRNAAIDDGADSVFDELWKAVVTLVTHAKNKGLDVGTNGKPSERVVWKGDPPHLRPQDAVKLTITLNREAKEITVSGPNQKLALSIDVCDDLVACLKNGGKPIPIQDAAKLILDPFFFPELQNDPA